MAKYKFPQFETVFENPTITINGEVGINVINDLPTNTAFCDILIETPQTSNSSFRLEGSPEPVNWTITELSIWVNTQLIQYEVI